MQSFLHLCCCSCCCCAIILAVPQPLLLLRHCTVDLAASSSAPHQSIRCFCRQTNSGWQNKDEQIMTYTFTQPFIQTYPNPAIHPSPSRPSHSSRCIPAQPIPIHFDQTVFIHYYLNVVPRTCRQPWTNTHRTISKG